MLSDLWWVGCGGFAGSAGRYVIAGWVQRTWPALGVPAGTLAVNVLGSLAIGLASGWITQRGVSDPRRLLVIVGVLGGFTTFSTFSLETLQVWENAGAARAALNVLVQVVLGLGAAFVGLRLAGH
jgi:CrcB protein